nr:MAG TPA: Nfn subunit A, Nfn subunit [Caudoviricetes sp.]
MANNRICLTCGKPYEYCGSCPSSLNLPVWKNLFDTENCKTVFETVSDYAQNAITKESAKVRLSKCDVSGIFKDNIKKLIDDINKEDAKNIATKENEIKAKYGNKKKSVSVIDD